MTSGSAEINLRGRTVWPLPAQDAWKAFDGNGTYKIELSGTAPQVSDAEARQRRLHRRQRRSKGAPRLRRTRQRERAGGAEVRRQGGSRRARDDLERPDGRRRLCGAEHTGRRRAGHCGLGRGQAAASPHARCVRRRPSFRTRRRWASTAPRSSRPVCPTVSMR